MQGDLLPWRPDPKNSSILLLLVKVIPGASRTAAAGLRTTAEGPALLIRIAAAPEKGKANDELIAWLSDVLEVPRRSLSLRSGQTSRQKLLALPVSCGARLSSLVP